MTKKLFIIFAAATALLIAGKSKADELKPLAEAAAQETSPAMMLYVMKRCASAHASVAMRIGDSTRSQDQDLKAAEERAAAYFLSIGKNVIAETNLPDTDETLVRDISEMSASYLKMMQANYVATGNAMGDQMKADILYCKSVLEN